jgi:hypothetical protein
MTNNIIKKFMKLLSEYDIGAFDEDGEHLLFREDAIKATLSDFIMNGEFENSSEEKTKAESEQDKLNKFGKAGESYMDMLIRLSNHYSSGM